MPRWRSMIPPLGPQNRPERVATTAMNSGSREALAHSAGHINRPDDHLGAGPGDFVESTEWFGSGRHLDPDRGRWVE